MPGRQEAYRRIAGICTAEESSDLIDELIDRYGDPPKAILGLINVSLIRNMASKAGVTEISQREDRIYMYIRTAAPEQIMALSAAYPSRLLIKGDGLRPYVSVRLLAKDDPVAVMQHMVEVFSGASEKKDK